MKVSLLLFPVLFLVSSCTSVENEKKPEAPVVEQHDKIQVPAAPHHVDSMASAKQSRGPAIDPGASVELKTYKDSIGWGYDIYLNGKKAIHQPLIPAVPGKQPFANEGDAKKAGNLVVFKIKHNLMPPAVSVQELDSLHIAHSKSH
jgi:hypothetical protein